jgi:hypothetical protein
MIRPMIPAIALRRISHSQAVAFVFLGASWVMMEGTSDLSVRGLSVPASGGPSPAPVSTSSHIRWGGSFPGQKPGGSKVPFGEEGLDGLPDRDGFDRVGWDDLSSVA